LKQLALCILLFGLFHSPPSPTQSLDIVAVPLAGATVSSLIDKFDEMARRIVRLAGEAGNGMVGRAGEELRLSIANLNILLDDQREKAFEDLDVELQQAFRELNAVIASVNGLSTQVADLEEIGVLDVHVLLSRMPLVERQSFLVQSVRGYTLLPTRTDHALKIRGIGFGLGDPNQKCAITFNVDGTEVTAQNFVLGPDRYTLTIHVPDELVRGRFDVANPRHVPVVFTCKINERRFFRSVERRYDIPFDLVLLPEVPGSIVISQWVRSDAEPSGDILSKPIRVTWNRNSCTVDHPCIMGGGTAYQKCVADNEQIVGVRYECDGACGFATSLRRREHAQAIAAATPGCINETARARNITPEEARDRIARPRIAAIERVLFNRCIDDRTHNYLYAPDFEIQSDKKCAEGFRRYDADVPTTITYQVDYQRLSRRTLMRDSEPIPLKYGQPIVVDLDPSNHPACSFRASGKVTFTNALIDINQVSGGSAQPLKLVSAAEVGGHCQLTLRLDL
jgi:hypothetical protein